MVSVNLFVNGKEHLVEIDPEMPLLWALRDILDLTGTKYSCGIGECGSCSVLIEGEAVRSCITPASSAEGKEITTIEGLSNGTELHPLQTAFVEEGALQCGYCTPGMVLTAKALLDENPNPTEDEIKTGISGNLCRCTGYKKIVEAIQVTAEKGR